VFLSYSRKDAAFTRRLAEALASRGYTPDFDQSERDPIHSGIAVGEEWWPRLKDMIAATDVMVFIISPDSATSPVCDDEIAYARDMGKRIVPVVWRKVDFSKLPQRLAALNIGKIDFTDEGEAAFAAALDRLATALDLHVDWHREATRLMLLAARWDNAGRKDDLLLTETDVRAVGKLLETRPANVPEPSEILVALRDASRAKLDAEETKQRRIIGRSFVKPVKEALKVGRHEHALRLAAAGALLARDLDFDPELDTQLWGPAAQAILESRTCAILAGHTNSVLVAWFSPDDRRIVTASRDHTARIWDAVTGQQIACLEGHTDIVQSALFSPDGRQIITASHDHTAAIWDAKTGQQIVRLEGHTDIVQSALFSPDGRRIVTASHDHTARIWDAAMGQQIAVLQGHAGSVWSAAFSPDGQRMVTASSDHSARLWDAATGQQIAVLQGHAGSVWSASFSPNGRRIVTASDDHTARIWAAATGKEITPLRGHTETVRSASFSPDGRRIVTASQDHTARIWDGKTGTPIAVLVGHTANAAGLWPHGVYSAAFSPTGRRIVTASEDNTARIWDATTGTQIATLIGHAANGAGLLWTPGVYNAAFSTNGQRIITAS
jgi:WD40 repeat protein